MKDFKFSFAKPSLWNLTLAIIADLSVTVPTALFVYLNRQRTGDRIKLTKMYNIQNVMNHTKEEEACKIAYLTAALQEIPNQETFVKRHMFIDHKTGKINPVALRKVRESFREVV